MKTPWRAADRGELWEGSQHLRHWKAEAVQVTCMVRASGCPVHGAICHAKLDYQEIEVQPVCL